jgi:predicted deacylase
MDRRIVSPAQLDLESQGRRDYLVALPHDGIWGDHLIPLTVFVGPEAEPGKGLVAFGSTHGNEYEGPVAIKRLMSEIDVAEVRGRIILVPVLNVAAFRAGARDSVLDDGVNLNRAFVDQAGRTPSLGRITYRIADFVRSAIWPQVHIVLDLHAGGEVAQFALGPSFHPIPDPEQNRRIEQTARSFGAPIVLVYQNETPGLLTTDAERLGKITIGAELGFGRSINPDGVRFARHGIMAAAIQWKQLRGRVEPIAHHLDGSQQKLSIVDRRCTIVAPFDGHYEPLRRPADPVVAGETVGYLHDFQRLELPPWAVRSEVSGRLAAQAWGARVMQGQHVSIIGEVVSWVDEA